MTNHAPISLQQLFRYWRALPHQQAAISELEAQLESDGYDATMRRAVTAKLTELFGAVLGTAEFHLY